MSILKEKKYLGILGNVLIIIGLFLPLISVPSSISGFMAAGGVSTSFISSGIGIILLIAAVCSLVIIFSDKIPALSKLNNQKLTLIPTAIIAFIVIGNIVNASSILALGSSVGVGLGIGVWLCIIGIVACIAYPFIYKGEAK